MSPVVDQPHSHLVAYEAAQPGTDRAWRCKRCPGVWPRWAVIEGPCVVVDQPAPAANAGESMHDLVAGDLTIWWPESVGVSWFRAELAERKRIGLERYGTLLQADNGRDALVDAFQESLDLTVYLRQALAEAGWPDGRPTHGLLEAYVSALRTAIRVGRLVRLRTEIARISDDHGHVE